MIKASVYFQGAAIWVSSTSFQKSDIGWPHQPPIEKFKNFFWKKEFECTKCKATFNFFFNIFGFFMPFWWEWELVLYILSDFPGTKNLCSLIDLSSLGNLIGLTSLTRPISSKKFLIMMVWSSLAPKWSILVPFCGINHQKSIFSLVFGTFSVGGCWGQAMLLF